MRKGVKKSPLALHHGIQSSNGVWYHVLDNNLFLAPIKPDRLRIFDIKTGTGAWPIRLADKYPAASISGNDLSPICPKWLDSNIKFVIDDVEEE